MNTQFPLGFFLIENRLLFHELQKGFSGRKQCRKVRRRSLRSVKCKVSPSGTESWPVWLVWGGHVAGGDKDAGEISSRAPACKESMKTVIMEKHNGKSKKDFKVESDTLSFMFCNISSSFRISDT